MNIDVIDLQDSDISAWWEKYIKSCEPINGIKLKERIIGPCELKDLPKDGPPVHYWQFERTPLKQWTAKYLGVSDIEGYERNLAYFEKAHILSKWRLSIIHL